jgi:hypothetical protein
VLHTDHGGELLTTVDHEPERGYGMWFRHFGRYVVSTDGRLVLCEATNPGGGMRERYIAAQALPLAAVLQGLEVLHASAVSVAGGAIAFLGPSGAGKSTIATRIAVGGAPFMCDDVLALSSSDGQVVAHSGVGFASVHAHDEEVTGCERVGEIIGASDKSHVALPLERRVLPLAAVYVIERVHEEGRLSISPLSPVPASLLLSNAFVPYLTTPERLLNQLALFGAIADQVPVFRLSIPRSQALSGLSGELERVVEHARATIGAS